jgi:hypothetical protein
MWKKGIAVLLVVLPGHYLKGTEESRDNPQDIGSPGQDLNPVPPERKI